MTTTSTRIAAAGLGLATTAVCAVLALTSPSATAADDPAPPASPRVEVSTGAVDLDGNPVKSRTHVGDAPPEGLGTLECSATVSVDGTVSDQVGSCGALETPAP